MAYSKVILNGVTLMDVTQKTVEANKLLEGYTALKNDGTSITGTYEPQTVNLQAKTNIAPSISSQTITPDAGYDGLSSVQINAMPTGTAGTPSATKGTVSNHAVSVTPSVTNTTGYITGGTKTGTAVSVAASELVSGTKSITENGTGIDVTNYASVDVNVSGGGASDFEVNAVTINTDEAQTYMLPVVYDDAGYPPNIVSTSIYIRANTPTTVNLLFYKGRCYTGLDNSMWGMTGVADYDEDYGYWYFTGSGTVHIEYD